MAADRFGDDPARADPGYAHFQAAKALSVSENHADPDVRQRAALRAAKWAQAYDGMTNETLAVGSRTPLKDIPAWATPEVLTGGFVSGNLLSGGVLQEHEAVLLGQLSLPPDASAPRLSINTYFMSDDGLEHLSRMLRTGEYTVNVPEEGALLVVAWLIGNGSFDAARALLDELLPYFSRLRFYPVPVPQLQTSGSRVHRHTVGEVRANLQRIEINAAIEAQKEAVGVWAPLYDAIVRLFLDTVEGDNPSLLLDERGKPMLQDGKRYQVHGGWPCQRFPDGWFDDARSVVDDCVTQRRKHRLCSRFEASSFAQLRVLLERCILGPHMLTGRDVARIRLVLACYIHKRGIPRSEANVKVRAAELATIAAPTLFDAAQQVIRRLNLYPAAEGLDDLTAVLEPIDGRPVPPNLRNKLQRCLTESIDVLIHMGVIPSGEVMATVLPQVTSALRARSITDPDLGRLYATIYRAFRKRRSLLLLNLESQVRLEELPWVAAINRFRDERMSEQIISRQTLEEMATLAITSFPWTIIPNKLAQELRTLVSGAKLDLPLVDELAADIFMGEFGSKFLMAAQQAGDLLHGTLYATYYGIDYDAIRLMNAAVQPGETRWLFRRAAVVSDFAALCAARAGVTTNRGTPAANGMVIEQQQILTTQNLAPIFKELMLQDKLSQQIADLAQRCFLWICRSQQTKLQLWHARLIMIKNTAYAWRQMIFFLSLLSRDEQVRVLSWCADHFGKQSVAFRNRFAPAMKGLSLAAAGESPDGAHAAAIDARRFLGWSVEQHWLLVRPG